MALTIAILLATLAHNRPISNFALEDVSGRKLELYPSKAKLSVVVFLGVDCPMANRYASRLKQISQRYSSDAVRFIAINSNDYDEVSAMAKFTRDHDLTFPFLKDHSGRVARDFDATRSPQAFVVDAAHFIRYRGRIDDQFAPGGRNKGKPSREDLVEAIEELLSNRSVSIPLTEALGCALEKPKKLAAESAVTYHKDIRPILARHCQECHRPGQIGPFHLTTYESVRDRANTLAEVIDNGTMPPWHASPLFGRFRNDRRLSNANKELIAEWIRLGCPEGEVLAFEQDPTSATGWLIGSPDAVFAMPHSFQVPAEGVIEYQHFVVGMGFENDVWVREAEVRPGNRRIVHHCNVFLQPPTATDVEELYETGALGSSNLIAFTPGSGALKLPHGTAKRIPAGWKLHFIIHYTSIGTPQSDRTELGLNFLPATEVRKEIATKLLLDPDLIIPPHAAAHTVERTWIADRDVMLFSMFPHMHLRGKSFRYEVEYPDRSTEILLDVPAYDFNWQHRYELTEPKRLPLGSILRCTAVFDNSLANPNNPDATAIVREGPQSWDEMFNAFFEIALADQDLIKEYDSTLNQRRLIVNLWCIAALLTLFAILNFIRKRFTRCLD